MDIFQDKDNGVAFNLLLQPRSSFAKLCGKQGNALKLRVCSPPVDDMANKECCKYFADIFSVPKNSVQVIKGKKARRKKIFTEGINSKKALRVLNEHLL